MNKLTLNYKDTYLSQDVDLKRLRPNKSYDFLIKNRNQDLNALLRNPKRLKKFLKKRSCPSCNSSRSNLACLKDGLKIVRCKKCSLIFVSPTFDYDHYINLYKNKKYQKIVKKLGEKSHLYRVKRFGLERVNIIEKYLSKNKKPKVLDIGCSTGFFIEACKKKGWDTLGLELNPSAVNFGKKRGLNIQNSDFLKTKFKKKFDVICAFDVLEHLHDPMQVVKKAYKDLNKNGLLFVYVPNWQSASRLLLGEENSHFIWPTHHLTYFTPKTLQKFLSNAKFETVFWETQGLDTYDINWYLNYKNDNSKFYISNLDKIQFMFNSAGYGKNLRMLAIKK